MFWLLLRRPAATPMWPTPSQPPSKGLTPARARKVHIHDSTRHRQGCTVAGVSHKHTHTHTRKRTQRWAVLRRDKSAATRQPSKKRQSQYPTCKNRWLKHLRNWPEVFLIRMGKSVSCHHYSLSAYTLFCVGFDENEKWLLGLITQPSQLFFTLPVSASKEAKSLSPCSSASLYSSRELHFFIGWGSSKMVLITGHFSSLCLIHWCLLLESWSKLHN